jgi:hypothetical protein
MQNDTCKDGVQDKIVQIEEIMDEQSQRRLATNLIYYNSNALLICPKPQSKKLVLPNFFSTSKIRPNLPNYIVLAKITLAH